MAKHARTPIGSDDLPARSGVYLVYSNVSLPLQGFSPADGPVYVGKDEQNVGRRVRQVHLGDSGRSTLRRSYGALLRSELVLEPRPRRGGGGSETDFTNFAFEPEGEVRLTDWMTAHLSVEVVPRADPGGRKAELVTSFGPPLNLKGWPNPWAQAIGAARAECAAIARRRFGDPTIYSIFERDRRHPRARSPEADFSRHGHWVRHRLFGWVGRINCELVETGELVINWESGASMEHLSYATFGRNEVAEVDRAPTPWLESR